MARFDNLVQAEKAFSALEQSYLSLKANTIGLDQKEEYNPRRCPVCSCCEWSPDCIHLIKP